MLPKILSIVYLSRERWEKHVVSSLKGEANKVRVLAELTENMKIYPAALWKKLQNREVKEVSNYQKVTTTRHLPRISFP